MPFGGKCIVASNVVAMDNLVSVPVTHPCRFLKGQSAIKSPEPDPPVRRPAQKSARKDPLVRRPTKSRDDPPVTSLQSADNAPVIPKKTLAQEWLDF